MNAVNLIPGDRRKRNVSVSISPLTLGVIGGLVVVLVAAVLYVFAVNDVRARKSELARVTANAASWQAAANSYASYVTAARSRSSSWPTSASSSRAASRGRCSSARSAG